MGLFQESEELWARQQSLSEICLSREEFWRSKKALGLARREYWSVINSSVADHNTTFDCLFGETPFSKWLRHQADKQDVFYGLEACGNFQAFRGLLGDIRGCFCELSDSRRKWQAVWDKRHGVKPYLGNIFNNKGQLFSYLHDEKLSGFNVVVCRPEGGWRSGIGMDYEIQYNLANMLYQLSSNVGGSLVIQLNPEKYYRIWADWMKLLEQTYGGQFAVNQEHTSFRITRTADTPNELPRI